MITNNVINKAIVVHNKIINNLNKKLLMSGKKVINELIINKLLINIFNKKIVKN